MNVEYINPFIEASRAVLKQIAGIDVKLGSISLKNSPYASDNFFARKDINTAEGME